MVEDQRTGALVVMTREAFVEMVTEGGSWNKSTRG